MGRQRFKCWLAIATLVRSTSLLTVKSVTTSSIVILSIGIVVCWRPQKVSTSLGHYSPRNLATSDPRAWNSLAESNRCAWFRARIPRARRRGYLSESRSSWHMVFVLSKLSKV